MPPLNQQEHIKIPRKYQPKTPSLLIYSKLPSGKIAAFTYIRLYILVTILRTTGT